jgi:hypothetical protein
MNNLLLKLSAIAAISLIPNTALADINFSKSDARSEAPTTIAWEWPWASSPPQHPFCFAIEHNYDFLYKTVYGSNRYDAENKILTGQKDFQHAGPCQCEGRSATDNPPCPER